MRFTRITLIFIAGIIVLGFDQLARRFLRDVEPQTFQATEEAMVDAARILAETVVPGENGTLDTTVLARAVAAARARDFEALIFDHRKTRVGLHAYVTDAAGRVIFDSDGGRREGRDFSQMRDVALTLDGRYGARSSREAESDASSSVLHVAAPIGDPAAPAGVLTVYKPQADILPLVRERRRVILRACALIGSGILFLIAAVFLWLFRPIGRITDYARAIERGERPPKPKIGIGREVNTLAGALDSMRDALEGRRYAERYIQTLTHEMKSPLAAIRGAAELLDEEMPVANRRRFLENIRAECARTGRLIDRLLELSVIESRTGLEDGEPLDLREVVARALSGARPMAEVAGVELDFPDADGPPLALRGNTFILRSAVTNLLENAIDFSPRGGRVEVSLRALDGKAELAIADEGPGIPDYARERVFERFYSLRHHAIGRKGSGLGLTLVREAAELHGGSAALECPPAGGTRALLLLPLAEPG